MTSNNDILTELTNISGAVAAIPATNVFTVPENYFNTLPANILQLIRADNVPTFGSIQKQTFSLPEGYFDGLAGDILSKIKAEKNQTPAEEMHTLSSVIANISNRNVFSVPSGYFNTIDPLSFNQTQAPAKVVQMKPKSGMLRYMAAAAVAGIIGLTIFNQHPKAIEVQNDYAPAMADAQKIIKDKSFDAELNKISDSDIEAYLRASGEDVNAALVASAADANNLPSAEDYILNDNTLDEFLNKINLNN